MKKGNLLIIVIGLLAVALMGGGCSSYNSMVQKQEATSSQWAQVENAYQRRADLIPNLVATVKGYAEHEKSTLQQVVEARAKATQVITQSPTDLSPEKIKQVQQSQGELSAALGKLLMIRENYPDLKANQNFLSLQDELAGTENRIAVERNKFNLQAQEYNQYIRRIPQVIYAKIFGFKTVGYFQAEQGAQKAPAVQF